MIMIDCIEISFSMNFQMKIIPVLAWWFCVANIIAGSIILSKTDISVCPNVFLFGLVETVLSGVFVGTSLVVISCACDCCGDPCQHIEPIYNQVMTGMATVIIILGGLVYHEMTLICGTKLFIYANLTYWLWVLFGLVGWSKFISPYLKMCCVRTKSNHPGYVPLQGINST